MKTFSRLFVLACSVLIFAACGQTSSEKAKESADSSIAALKSSANTLDAMGTPRSSWSDSDFVRYETALNSCESSANRIESLNGKDGVTVYGTWSLPRLRSLLSINRSALASARSEKTKLASAEAMDIQLREDKRLLMAEGAPDATWTLERMEKYEAILNRIETVVKASEDAKPTWQRSDKVLVSIQELRDAVRTARADKPAA